MWTGLREPSILRLLQKPLDKEITSRSHKSNRAWEEAQEDAEKSRPARPQRVKGQGVRGWYVEALSDARTPLEGFCNILSLSFSLRGTIDTHEVLSRREGRDIAMQAVRQNPLSLVEQKACEVACTLLASEPRVKVFLFGSQATGRAGSRSDIDLGIDLGHAIAPEVLTALREAFDELPIMQKVDVVDFFGVDEAFKAVALQEIASLYERQAA